jgi:hypothetical protein
MQEPTIICILADEKSCGRLVVVDRMGGGTSLTLTMTMICMGGGGIHHHPPLAFAHHQPADALGYRRSVLWCHPSTSPDETEGGGADLCGKVIPKMDVMDYSSSKKLLLLCLPQ